MIQNFCHFLNRILFYLLFDIYVIEFNTVKRIYTQFNFKYARYLIKRDLITYSLKKSFNE